MWCVDLFNIVNRYYRWIIEIEDVKKLKAKLFDGVKYDTTIRPIVNQSEAIEVCELNNKYEYLLILDKKSQRMILCS